MCTQLTLSSKQHVRTWRENTSQTDEAPLCYKWMDWAHNSSDKESAKYKFATTFLEGGRSSEIAFPPLVQLFKIS